LELFLTLREVSVEVVEAIVAWRWKEGGTPGGPLPLFVWNGLDYLHKMCNDLDFLAGCEPLVRAGWALVGGSGAGVWA
jgi:hypothetical protein